MKATNKSSLLFSIIALGFSSIITQVVIMREFLSVFSGNEFIIGIYLANWMILTGTGAFLGRFLKKPGIKLIIWQLIILSLLPFLSLLLFYYINGQLFPPGYSPGPVPIWIYILISISPFCFLSGSLFVLISKELSSYKDDAVSNAYGLESFGSIIGGLIFTFVFLSFLNAFQTLAIVFAMLIFSALYLIAKSGKPKLANYLGGPASTIFIIALLFGFHEEIRKQLYIGQELIETIDTKYNKIDISKMGDQMNIYQDHDLVYTNTSSKSTEEIIHFPLVLHDHPEKILVIGGLISESLKEVQKYHPEIIVYPESCNEIIDLARVNYNGYFPANTSIINTDPGIFLRNDSTLYDIIITDLPDPVTANFNKYYSLEFFAQINDHMDTNGIFILSLESPGYYINDEALKLLSIVFNTMAEIFTNVRIIASDKNYILGSSANMGKSIIEEISSKQIETSYVNKYIMSDAEIDFKSHQVLNSLDSSAEINTNTSPIAYFYRIQHWVNQYGINIHIVFIILLIAGFIFFLFQNPVNQGLFITGFTGASLEFILILAFQIVFGSIYYYSALLIALFMAGIAIGALYSKRIIDLGIKNYMLYYLLSGILIPGIIILAHLFGYHGNSGFTFFIIMTLMIVTGLITGIIFAQGAHLLSSKESIQNTASGMYGSDLIGASIGIFITSLYIIPYWGIITTCIILAILNILYVAYVLLIRKKLLSL